MAILVVGGHSRNVGKTSVVAGLIAAMPERRWTAMKISQHAHGACSDNGAPCGRAVDELKHGYAITQERDRSGDSDTSRFLVAGARRSLWVRTRPGCLAEAMDRIRRELERAADDGCDVILESNSILRFLRPELYLAVLDPANPDFKQSARVSGARRCDPPPSTRGNTDSAGVGRHLAQGDRGQAGIPDSPS